MKENCYNVKATVMKSRFGHEIWDAGMAAALGVKVKVSPTKETEEEYYSEARTIIDYMSFFYKRDMFEIVPFEKRGILSLGDWDIVSDLRSGHIPEKVWNTFFKYGALTPQWEPETDYTILFNPVLVIPQKLFTDGGCGVTAQQQSVDPEVLSFLKGGNHDLVIGQHFDKIKDLEVVKALAQSFDAYIPGLTENPEVLGLRGVPHAALYKLYKQLYGSVGIAGTHTWYLLAMCPRCKQIILYNRKGVEDWEAIAASARFHGRQVWAIGFDDSTNMTDLQEAVKACYYQHFLH